MFNSAHGNVTVSVFFDQRRAVEGEKYPVKIRVRHNRDRKDFATGKKLTLDEWDKLPTTKSLKLIKTKSEIQKSFNIVDSAVLELFNTDIFSFEALNVRLSKGALTTLNSAFMAKINNLEKDDRIGSFVYYQTALKSVTSFRGECIKFAEVTPDWLKRYERYLLDSDKTFATVGMYMRAIRTIINDAKRCGIIKENQYPFGKDKYDIPTGEGRKLALTMQQIKEVVTFSDGLETTERYRDLWFFSYLCNGINFADMLKLKYANIVNDEICFFRQKTIRTSKKKKEICATITPEMQAIIERWGNSDRKPDNFIFPYLTGKVDAMKENKIIRDVTKRTNMRLKKIGEALNIDGISTYTARHSYASVLKRSGANIAFISESLGHNDLKTTESYLASFEKEERKKNAALLTNFD